MAKIIEYVHVENSDVKLRTKQDYQKRKIEVTYPNTHKSHVN